jgi:hypothetical protein
MQKIYLPASSRATIIRFQKEFSEIKNDHIQIGAVE